MENIKIENIDKLLQSKSSEKLLIKALKGLKVDKKDRKSRVALIVICIMIAALIGFCNDTVIILQNGIDVILNVLLALGGMIFTGYALLQAFMNKQLLLHLLSDTKKEKDGEEKSRLQDVNENFVYLMLLYVVIIIESLVLKIILLCIPNEFLLCENIVISNSVASILMFFYFLPISIILLRTISFVSSIFNLFNAYAVAQIIEILDEDEK